MFTQKTVPLKSNTMKPLDRIGEGAYSSVFEISDTSRVIKIYGKDSWMDFKNEVSILHLLCNYNRNGNTFIKCYDYGYCQKTKKGWSVLPKLHSDLELHPPSDSKYWSIAVQLLNQIEQLHELGIIHQDIKPANIMWTDENKNSSAMGAELRTFGIAVKRANHCAISA